MINLIFNTFTTLEQTNVTGINGVLIAASDATGGWYPGLILFALFMILGLSSYFSTMRRTGRADVFGSFAVAGFVCAIVAILFSLIPGFINMLILTLTITIAILCVVLLWFNSRDR